jgi:putative phage-type endonuclease
MTVEELRRTGIGGTDASAIACLNPYITPYDVYLDKLGLRKVEENEAMFLGRFFEGRICDLYAEREGVTLIKPPTKLGVLRSADRPWMVGSPDRLVAHRRIGVDAKMAGMRQMWRWGQEGTDRVPDEYHAQAQWYLNLTGFERWDIAVLLGQSFKIYRVEPNADLQAALIGICERFWRDHIEKRVPPPADHSDNARKMLQALYPREQEPLRPATDEEVTLVRELRKIQKDLDLLDRHRHYTLNRLRETIALADGIAGDGFRITWRRAKDIERVDWKAVAEDAMARLPYDEGDHLVSKYTTTQLGQRILRPYFKEAEE